MPARKPNKPAASKPAASKPTTTKPAASKPATSTPSRPSYMDAAEKNSKPKNSGGGGGIMAFQRKTAQRQAQQFRKAQKRADEQFAANMAFNRESLEVGRQDSWEQFELGMMNQRMLAEQQMAAQEAQFAQAQEFQERQLLMQMEQNEKMALESEKAANRAMGLKLVGQDADVVKVKSNIKRKNRRRQATQGTGQLTNPRVISNPLTISLGL